MRGRNVRGRRWLAAALVLLLACMIALSGCAEVDDGQDGQDAQDGEDQEMAGNVGSHACEAHEREVEPGVCSYIIECDDAEGCELWSDDMVALLTEGYGDLVYAEEWDVDEKDSEKEPDAIAAFAVDGEGIDLAPSDEDEEYYAWLWERFAWIIPSAERQMVSRFEVYDHADTMAYVVQDEEDYESWTYASNQIQATYETERIMTDIHEFGHLLSLNAEQVDPYADESQCGTYMLDEGCAEEHAYIYQFYLQFWEDGDSENEDDFVTEYAMSDVYEDFAESWAYFVMSTRPTGDSVVDRKVGFFYDYDELVMLKADILGRTASWLDRHTEA